MNILITTIMRNTEWFFNRYNAQLNSLVREFGDEHKFWLSIYENDSVDNTKKMLELAPWIGFEGVCIRSQDIGTKFYGHDANADRVQNLAKARNIALNTNYLYHADYVLSIEGDVIFDNSLVARLLENVEEYDILSSLSRSFHFNNDIADGWAIRLTKDCVNSTEFRNRKLHLSNEIVDVWSTYNGFCFYRAEPLRHGHNFGWVNKRLGGVNGGDRPDIDWTCDTAIICENFRSNGYDKIGIDTSVTIDWD